MGRPDGGAAGGARGGAVTGRLAFAKYQGAGNDFVVVDGRRPPAAGGGPADRDAERDPDRDWAALALRLCDRHFGVGADGLLVAAPPTGTGAALQMLMYNPDGSLAEMCGNGLRCFVRWLVDRGEAGGGRLPVETGAGVLTADVGPDGRVEVNMGPPRLQPAAIPLDPAAAGAAGAPPGGPVLALPLEVPPVAAFPGARYEATCVSMGNPHAVVFVPDAAAVPLEVVGPVLETHPAFPARTNVEFCQVIDPGRIRVRVWERGAGITLACGTGACAAAVAARLRGYVHDRVVVELPGGALTVVWPGDPVSPAGPPATVSTGALPPVFLGGPAAHVFDGAVPL